MHVTQVTLCPFYHGCRHRLEGGHLQTVRSVVRDADDTVCFVFGVCVLSPLWPIACQGNVECKLHVGLVKLCRSSKNPFSHLIA